MAAFKSEKNDEIVSKMSTLMNTCSNSSSVQVEAASSQQAAWNKIIGLLRKPAIRHYSRYMYTFLNLILPASGIEYAIHFQRLPGSTFVYRMALIP